MTQNLKMFFAGFFLSLPFWWGVNLFQDNLEQVFYAQITQPLEEITLVKIPPREQKPKLELLAKEVISVKINKLGKEKIIFRKEADTSLPIASLTKLMAAIVILEDSNYDLEKTWITVSNKAAGQEDVPNYGNLKSGEGFPARTLLELMLLYSSNDAAWAFSEVIGVENFVEKMNQKTIELGLEKTHFINPTGLDPEGVYYTPENLGYFNYSTPTDLVKLSQYILQKHPLIFEISLRTGPYAVHDGISKLSLPENLKMVGGKTGFTEEAGGCILFVLQDEKSSYFFNVILGAESPSARLREAQKLINWL